MPHFGLENDSSTHCSSDGIGAWVGSGQYWRECRTGDEAAISQPRRPRRRNLAMLPSLCDVFLRSYLIRFKM